jgi:hypothetical protein
MYVRSSKAFSSQYSVPEWWTSFFQVVLGSSYTSVHGTRDPHVLLLPYPFADTKHHILHDVLLTRHPLLPISHLQSLENP